VGETLVKGMEDVEVGGIAGKKMPPGVQLDERSKAGGESCPDVLEGGTRVVVQVPKDETSQVAQEGAQVELCCIRVAKPPQTHSRLEYHPYDNGAIHRLEDCWYRNQQIHQCKCEGVSC